MFVILMGLLGSLGALLPAGLVLFIPDGWRQWMMPNLLGFATGTMLATATIGLLPEALGHRFVGGAGPVLYSGMDGDLASCARGGC